VKLLVKPGIRMQNGLDATALSGSLGPGQVECWWKRADVNSFQDRADAFTGRSQQPGRSTFIVAVEGADAKAAFRGLLHCRSRRVNDLDTLRLLLNCNRHQCG
jgi:hypothetical protein